MRQRVCYLFIAIVALAVDPPRVVGQPAPPASPAVDAALARQEAARTVEIEFNVKEVVAAGGITAEMPEFTKGKVVPEKETTLESVNKVVFDGKKVRYENNHPIWAPERGALNRIRLINVCDGQINKNLYTVGLNDPNIPEGFISRHSYSYDIKSNLLIPLTLTLRGLEPSITPYMVSDLKTAGATLPVGGVSCEEYVMVTGRDRVIKCWLDPNAGYLARRIQRESQGKPSERYDVKYQQDHKCGWVPESWVLTRFSTTGRVRITATVEITKLTCGGPYPDELFDVHFPPGAKVYDARNEKSYRVLSDGTMREYSLATGEDHPEVVSQPGDSWYRRHGTTATLIGVCVVLFGVVAVWAARRKRTVHS